METIHLPKFIREIKKDAVIHRLQLLNVLANHLAASRVVETDITIPIMKELAYLRPLPGITYLNDLEDTLKDLVFHAHRKTGKTDKTADLDLSEAKSEFFPKDMRDHFSKLLHVQSQLKKENQKCVDLYEQYALDLYRQRNSADIEAVRQMIASKRTLLMDREQIMRSHLESLSIQLAILIEKHITSIVRALRYNLKKQANSSGAPSEILESLQAIRPDRVANEIYLAIADTYSYPARPQNLIYCPDCKSCVPACPSTGLCWRDQSAPLPEEINSNLNASTINLASCQKALYHTAGRNYSSKTGRGLPIQKGDIFKTKIVSSDGRTRFGWKKRLLGLKKTWGFFPTAVVQK